MKQATFCKRRACYTIYLLLTVLSCFWQSIVKIIEIIVICDNCLNNIEYYKLLGYIFVNL